ncbi:hypothetical protein BR93DRAFT_969804 [Coniochaeta sp. PMI_546]|nr:hypothetical protein BR93DRAFT_969804 [Coniochaeta sp. PMI_546]
MSTLAVVSVPTGLDQQWYVNTANFYRQLRNIIIDATSTQNVQLIAGPAQTGMFAETGSGGQLSDIVFTGGAFATLLAGTAGRIDYWALGPVYTGAGTRPFSMDGKIGTYQRAQKLINSNTGRCFERAKPQYDSSSVGDFLHVKDFGGKGDGSTDDTTAFQQTIWASQGKILFIDAASYILTSNITVPTASRIVGET